MTLENLFVLIGMLVSLAAAGTGIAAMLKVRAEKGVLDAQRAQIEATAQEAKAKCEVAESETIRNFTEAMNHLIQPLNERIEKQDQLIKEQAERIAQVEKIAGEQGQAIIAKDCTIQAQADRIQVLEDKVCALQVELDEWKSGRRKKTAPLVVGGEA